MNTEPSSHRIQYNVGERHQVTPYRRHQQAQKHVVSSQIRPKATAIDYIPTRPTYNRPSVQQHYNNNKPSTVARPIVNEAHKYVLIENDEDYFYHQENDVPQTIFSGDIDRSARLISGKGISDYVNALSVPRIYY